MDYLSGGDLRYHICRHRRFNEETTRFWVACLVSGLEYFHAKNIIHRDIKPENLVIETDGKSLSIWCLLTNLLSFRVLKNHRLRYRPCMAWRKCSRHEWHTWLYGPWSHVQVEPHNIRRFLCRRCHGLRVHLWQGKRNKPFIHLSHSLFIASIYRQKQERDPWPYSIQADLDQAKRHTSRLVNRGSWFRE